MQLMIEERAKKTFMMFMSERCVKNRLRALWINHAQQLRKVVDRMEHYVMMKNKRKTELIEMWESEKYQLLATM